MQNKNNCIKCLLRSLKLKLLQNNKLFFHTETAYHVTNFALYFVFKVSGIDRHPLRGLLPKKKVSTYNLRNQTSQYPKVNTDRFKNSYVNCLIFKYNLAM